MNPPTTTMVFFFFLGGVLYPRYTHPSSIPKISTAQTLRVSHGSISTGHESCYRSYTIQNPSCDVGMRYIKENTLP